MFERYTEKARQVIFLARREALQYGSQVISPEHLLLGLLCADETLPERYFPVSNRLTVEDVRREVEERVVLREQIPQSAELNLAPEAKQILAFANEESLRLKNRYIETEHFLLGLLSDEHSIAAEILLQHGLRLQNLRETVARKIGFPLFYII